MKLQLLRRKTDGSKTWERCSLLTFLLVCLSSGLISAQPADQRIVVIMQGTAPGVSRLVPDIDGDGIQDQATCWDVDLVDAKTNRVIGTGTECASEVNLDGTGPKPIATTTFRFPEGTLVQRGKMSVQPVLWQPANNPDVDSDVTFITGAFPAPGVNNILSGTGRFAGARGRVRLSGAFTANAVTATLNCIFIIDLYGRSQ